MKTVERLLAEKLLKNQCYQTTTRKSFRLGIGLELAHIYRQSQNTLLPRSQDVY